MTATPETILLLAAGRACLSAVEQADQSAADSAGLAELLDALDTVITTYEPDAERYDEHAGAAVDVLTYAREAADDDTEEAR